MKLNTKIRYGLRMVVQIARHQGTVNTTLLGEEMHVSAKYLRKLAGPLEKHGILRSEQGLYGGYALNRPAAEIRLAMIFDAFAEPITLCEGFNGAHCALRHGCLVRPTWERLDRTIRDTLVSTTIGDILAGRDAAAAGPTDVP